MIIHYIQQFKIEVAQILNTLCEECNITSLSFEESNLSYSTSGGILYFTTDLIYSNSEGTITSTTLICNLISWLSAQEDSKLSLAGIPVKLSKIIVRHIFKKEMCSNSSSYTTSAAMIFLLLILCIHLMST